MQLKRRRPRTRAAFATTTLAAAAAAASGPGAAGAAAAAPAPAATASGPGAALPEMVVSASLWRYTAGHGAVWCSERLNPRSPQAACLPEIHVVEGQKLKFVNLDVIGHDLRSYELDPKTGQPIFGTSILRLGGSDFVRGVEALPPTKDGYHFFCTVHPGRTSSGGGMHGILRVLKAES